MAPQGALSHHHAPGASTLPTSSRERFSYCFWCIHPSTVSPSPDAAPCPHSPPSPTAWDTLAQSSQRGVLNGRMNTPAVFAECVCVCVCKNCPHS